LERPGPVRCMMPREFEDRSNFRSGWRSYRICQSGSTQRMRYGQEQRELAAHLLRDESVQRSNLREDTHLYTRESADESMKAGMFTHPGDIVDDTVDDFTLEWIENDRAIPCYGLRLSVSRNDHAPRCRCQSWRRQH
jgi:hypothetical protein